MSRELADLCAEGEEYLVRGGGLFKKSARGVREEIHRCLKVAAIRRIRGADGGA